MSQFHSMTRSRALFLSDLHLGARAARPGLVLDFLEAHSAETIYLVGDILDLWHGGRTHWPDEAEAVVRMLSARARAGTRVIYLSGNHDAVLREPGVARLPDRWELREAVTHQAADGQRFLVLHGDQADRRLFRFHVMTRIGSRLEAAVRAVDAWLGNDNAAPRPPQNRSRIERMIAKFNGVFVMGGRFERRLVKLAKAVGAQGVICGHSHRPALRDVDGALYANCGDWVDSFTALKEDHDGTLRLVAWAPASSTMAHPSGPVTQGA